jgi:hypothetical protein
MIMAAALAAAAFMQGNPKTPSIFRSGDSSKEKAEAIAFNASIDRELRMAKEPSADNFVFNLMGHGSLVEQANVYVMFELIGRRIDEKFLKEASMMLMSCINKTLQYYGIIENFMAHYEIEPIPFDDKKYRLIVKNRFGDDIFVQYLNGYEWND